jgi:SagB-type dehydrogenase family enzyme
MRGKMEEPALGTIAEEYHLASGNPRWVRDFASLAQSKNDPRILALQAEPPLRLDGEVRIPLPRERVNVRMTLDDAIAARTSGRRFGTRALRAEELAALLHLGNGVRRVDCGPSPWYQRNAPSSGNLGSVEAYPIVLRAEGVPAGIYHFDSLGHELAAIRAGHFGAWLGERALLQPELAEAAVAIVLTCAFGRLHAKYGLRGYRLGLLDAGHVSENLHLAATGLGLQVCAVGGFVDDEIHEALGIDGLERATVLVVVVGPRPDLQK